MRARYRCRKCGQTCTLIECADWPAAQESACCHWIYETLDPLPICDACGDEFEDGTVGEVNECAYCAEERSDDELRLVAKGRVA